MGSILQPLKVEKKNSDLIVSYPKQLPTYIFHAYSFPDRLSQKQIAQRRKLNG